MQRLPQPLARVTAQPAARRDSPDGGAAGRGAAGSVQRAGRAAVSVSADRRTGFAPMPDGLPDGLPGGVQGGVQGSQPPLALVQRAPLGGPSADAGAGAAAEAAAAPASAPPPPSAPAQTVDVQQVADRVYTILCERLTSERERRGL